MKLARPLHYARIRRLLRTSSVVAILGARQVGKTTLARELMAEWPGRAVAFDLENPAEVATLADPLLALQSRRGLVVFDEVQRQPELFPVLRVLADRQKRLATFLVLGSASPALLRQSSESLAGRIAFHELDGFSLGEVGAQHLTRRWRRGGFPRAFLAASERQSVDWRRDFVQTFLERDLPQLGVTIPSMTLRRFWAMLAHYHGQVWNASEFARSFGVSDMTVRRYLDVLAGTFVIRILPPWHENLGKRQVKSPRIYLADSGLLHTLLDLRTQDDLEQHPKVGASWEGFAISVIVQRLGARWSECYFWRTHAGAELDLLVVRGRTRLGFEIKRTVSPAVTPSIRTALADLRLTRLDVIHAGDQTFPLAPRVRAVALSRVLEDLAPLR
jgi:predicted AAA+ superfamily ATPase